MKPEPKEKALFTDEALSALAAGFLKALLEDERRYGQGARVMDIEVGLTPTPDYTILIITQPADHTGKRIHRQLRDTAQRLLAAAHDMEVSLERTMVGRMP
jgi:hypothetical protein